jgi:hypothetical protein
VFERVAKDRHPLFFYLYYPTALFPYYAPAQVKLSSLWQSFILNYNPGILRNFQ